MSKVTRRCRSLGSVFVCSFALTLTILCKRRIPPERAVAPAIFLHKRRQEHANPPRSRRVAWPDVTSPSVEHEKTIVEMALALDASRAAELALQRQITDLRAELRRATKEFSSRAETQPSVPDTTQPPQEAYIVKSIVKS